MKISELKNEGLTRQYSVVVDAGTIAATVENRLKAMSNRVKIPGFRPGHIPMKVLQQRYGKNIMGEVLEKAVNDASTKVIKDNNLRTAMQPKVEVKDYKEGGDLSFELTAEIMPDVPELDYSKITLEKLVYELPESEVEEGIERLSKRNRKLEKKDAGQKAKKGDVVTIDFTGKKDGVPFEGGAAKKFRLELGSNQFIPGFEDQLIGAKEGDTPTVKVSFPADYHKADLAGAPVEFDIVVHEVLEAKNPEINDEFAKSVGFESLDTLKAAVREQINGDYGTYARSKLKKQLFDWLEANTSFPIPQGMYDLEFKSIWDKLMEAKSQGDESLNKSDDELKAEYGKIATRRVRLGILLAEVGRKNNLQVTKEELTKAVLEQAKMFPGQEKKVFDFYRENPHQVDDLRGPILEDKAVDFILSKASFTERKVNLAELTSPEDISESSSDEGKKKKPAKAKEEKTEAAAEGTEKKKAAPKKK